jgi:ATP-binding cassette subfamily B multidrug efflux pump
MATFMLMMVPRAAVCAERISEVLDTESSVVPAAAPVTTVRRRGEVELRNVQFQYPGAEAPVLRDVSLRAEPGRTTAIIGSTGAGKTTLLGLIPRLFDVTAGAVLVDGADVRELDFDVLWNRIGLVPQKAFLFSGTIASNLRYGRPDATDEELWQCLEIAQARDFVEELPEGLEAPVAQGGTNLSGGQRQRIAIARAILADPKLLILDEATSSLDSESEALIQDGLRKLRQGRTTFVIAHRLSTIRSADQILVLEGGEIVERGTHEDLLATDGRYKQLYDKQYNFERNQFVNPGEDFTPAPPPLKESLPPRLPNL